MEGGKSIGGQQLPFPHTTCTVYTISFSVSLAATQSCHAIDSNVCCIVCCRKVTRPLMEVFSLLCFCSTCLQLPSLQSVPALPWPLSFLCLVLTVSGILTKCGAGRERAARRSNNPCAHPCSAQRELWYYDRDRTNRCIHRENIDG